MLKTDRCSIYEIKESDLADVRILFTDDEVGTYLGGAYDKASARGKAPQYDDGDRQSGLYSAQDK